MAEFSKNVIALGDITTTNLTATQALQAPQGTITTINTQTLIANVALNLKNSYRISSGALGYLNIQNAMSSTTNCVNISNLFNSGSATATSSQLALFSIGKDQSAADQERLTLGIDQSGASLTYAAAGIGIIRPLNVMRGAVFTDGGNLAVTNLSVGTNSTLNNLQTSGSTLLNGPVVFNGNNVQFNAPANFQGSYVNLNNTQLQFANNLSLTTSGSATSSTNHFRIRNADLTNINISTSIANSLYNGTYQSQLSLYSIGTPEVSNSTVESLQIGANATGGYISYVIRNAVSGGATTRNININNGALFSDGGSLFLGKDLSIGGNGTIAKSLGIAQTLSVTGDTTLNTLSTTGAVSIGDNLQLTGNEKCLGSLTVGQSTLLQGTLDVNQTCNLNATANLKGNVNLTNANAALTISGSMSVALGAQFSDIIHAMKAINSDISISAPTVTAATALVSSGTASLNSLNVANATTLQGLLTSMSQADSSTNQPLMTAMYTAGGLYVTKNTLLNGVLNVSGSATFSSALINQSLTVNGAINFANNMSTIALTNNATSTNLLRVRSNDSTNMNIAVSLANSATSATTYYDSRYSVFALGTAEGASGTFERMDLGINNSGGYITNVVGGNGIAKAININNGAVFSTGGNISANTLQINNTSSTALVCAGSIVTNGGLTAGTNISTGANLILNGTNSIISLSATSLSLVPLTLGLSVVQNGALITNRTLGLRNIDATNTASNFNIAHATATTAYVTSMSLYSLGNPESNNANTERLQLGVTGQNAYLTYLTTGTGLTRPLNVYNGSVFSDGGSLSLNSVADVSLAPPNVTAFFTAGGAYITKGLYCGNSLTLANNLTLNNVIRSIPIIQGGTPISGNALQYRSNDATNTSLRLSLANNATSTTTYYDSGVTFYNLGNESSTNYERIALGINGNGGYLDYLYGGNGIARSFNMLSGAIFSTGGALILAGTLGVTGASTLTSLTATGTSTLAAVNATNINASGTLGVTGASTLTSLTATGTSTLAAVNATNINASGTLGVTGASTLTSLTATGTSNLAALNASGNTSLGGSLMLQNIMTLTAVTSAAPTVQGGSSIALNAFRIRSNDTTNTSARLSIANVAMANNYYDSGITLYSLGNNDTSTNSERITFGINSAGGYLNHLFSGTGVARAFNMMGGATFTTGGSLSLANSLTVTGTTTMIGLFSSTNTTDATSSTSQAALSTTGGLAVAKSAYVGGNLNITGGLVALYSNLIYTPSVSNTSVVYPLYALSPNMQSGGSQSNFYSGQSMTNNNCSALTFTYNGSGSAMNTMGLGLYGSNQIVISGSGATTINGTLKTTDTTPSTSVSTGSIVTNGGVGAANVYTNALINADPMTAIWYSSTTSTAVANRSIITMQVAWTLQASTGADMTAFYSSTSGKANQYTIVWPGTYYIAFTVRFAAVNANSVVETWLNCANSSFYGTNNTRLGKEATLCGTQQISVGARYTGYFNAGDIITPQLFVTLGTASLSNSTIGTGTDCTTTITCLMRHA